MVLEGFLLFFDAPKLEARPAVSDLALLREEGYPYELLHGLRLVRGGRSLFCFHGHQASKLFSDFNYLGDFVVTWADAPQAPPDTYALKLVPTRKEPDYESLVLVVDRSSFKLRMLMTSDQQGGQSTFSFTRLKENVNMPDSNFTFQIPRGVEVVYSDSAIK